MGGAFRPGSWCTSDVVEELYHSIAMGPFTSKLTPPSQESFHAFTHTQERTWYTSRSLFITEQT